MFAYNFERELNMDIFNFIMQCVFIFLATVGFSVIFNVKSSELLYCGLTGLVCFSIYKLFVVYLNAEFYGTVLGSFFAVLLARRFAFIRKVPTAIFVIPAIIPLAPGGTVYLTMYNVIYGEYMNVLKYAFITFKIAGGIVIGMSIALNLPNKLFNYKIIEKKR